MRQSGRGSGVFLDEAIRALIVVVAEQGTPLERSHGSDARPLFSRTDEARITELVVQCAGPAAEAAFQRVQADAIEGGTPIPAIIAAEVLRRLGFYRQDGP